MDTKIHNEQHAHNKEIIDQKNSPLNELICKKMGNGIDLTNSNLDNLISLVCTKVSIFCSVYTNHSIVADQQLV